MGKKFSESKIFLLDRPLNFLEKLTIHCNKAWNPIQCAGNPSKDVFYFLKATEYSSFLDIKHTFKQILQLVLYELKKKKKKPTCPNQETRGQGFFCLILVDVKTSNLISILVKVPMNN